MKECKICKKLKKEEEFSFNGVYKGKAYRTRICKKCRYKVYRTYNIKYLTRKRKSEGYEEYHKEKIKLYIQKYPEKQRARVLVRVALKKGKIFKTSCEKCGNLKVHAHHSDYSLPLKVNWLCITHHEKVHHAETD